ncbi:hypothetical protein [Mycobacterium avium]|uniref:hypothetical protein n=2 Tax=Mycobacterium avium TaxID=1764 RepID=UPI0003D1EE5D|nr:hypothetical protein [Mycobacterium avium]ETB06149.1 hypothetical protein P863_19285 [Mycobacterium avium subsp. silvaticum ATCC 49884]ETB13029.1 hypothetical protein O972_20430 [Mycobacterium avium subsp. avium 10-9275]ETB18439.1 hypothetical protein O973_19410 [Mycobacterium avium subsp. avium 11-4751]MDV3264470.1 hypothetical protein [Mycobacterium avium]UEA19542.1 hypothetical protein LK460_20775 [Mycobacterium avium subsp. avium]
MFVKTLISINALVATATVGACTAHANPVNFPDLSGYTPANVKDYEISVPNPGRSPDATVYFLTPDGIVCKFTLDQASCIGNNLPEIPPAASNPEAGMNGVNWIGTASGLNQTSGGEPSRVINGQTIKTLPPSHSLTVNGFICGVDNSGTTACKDPQGRGFVLSPHGSGWLPHV